MDSDFTGKLTRNSSLVTAVSLPNLPGIHQLPSISSGVGSTHSMQNGQPIFSGDSQFQLWGIGGNQLLPSSAGGLLGLSSLSALSSIPPMHPSVLMSGYSNYSAMDQYAGGFSSGFSNASSNALAKNAINQDMSDQTNDSLKRVRSKTLKVNRTLKAQRSNDDMQAKAVSNLDDNRPMEKRQKLDYNSIQTDKRIDIAPSPNLKLHDSDRKLPEKLLGRNTPESSSHKQTHFEDFGCILETESNLNDANNSRPQQSMLYLESPESNANMESKQLVRTIWVCYTYKPIVTYIFHSLIHNYYLYVYSRTSFPLRRWICCVPHYCPLTTTYKSRTMNSGSAPSTSCVTSRSKSCAERYTI